MYDQNRSLAVMPYFVLGLAKSSIQRISSRYPSSMSSPRSVVVKSMYDEDDARYSPEDRSYYGGEVVDQRILVMPREQLDGRFSDKAS